MIKSYFLSFSQRKINVIYGTQGYNNQLIQLVLSVKNLSFWYLYYWCVVVLCWSSTINLNAEYSLTIIHFTIIQECAIYRGLLRQSMSLYFPLRPQDKIFKERWIFTLQGSIFLSSVYSRNSLISLWCCLPAWLLS